MPRIADAHLDLAYLQLGGVDLTAELPADSPRCVSLPALARGEVDLALATIFTELGASDPGWGYRDHDDRDGAEAAGLAQLEVYESWERAGLVRLVRTVGDLDPRGDADRTLRLVLLMEGADPVRAPEDASRWFDRGVRVFGLSWAMGSRYAGGNARDGGLTAEGRALVDAIDACGGIHDLSHLSDQAFDEVMARARGRVLASHSNCRALLRPSARHLRDDQIEAVAGRRGVIGLNLFTVFLADDRRATIDDCLRHLDHTAESAGGREFVCLGSDMDGGFGCDELPESLEGPGRLPALLTALAANGWSREDVRGFAHANLDRFLRSALPDDVAAE